MLRVDGLLLPYAHYHLRFNPELVVIAYKQAGFRLLEMEWDRLETSGLDRQHVIGLLLTNDRFVEWQEWVRHSLLWDLYMARPVGALCKSATKLLAWAECFAVQVGGSLVLIVAEVGGTVEQVIAQYRQRCPEAADNDLPITLRLHGTVLPADLHISQIALESRLCNVEIQVGVREPADVPYDATMAEVKNMMALLHRDERADPDKAEELIQMDPRCLALLGDTDDVDLRFIESLVVKAFARGGIFALLGISWADWDAIGPPLEGTELSQDSEDNWQAWLRDHRANGYMIYEMVHARPFGFYPSGDAQSLLTWAQLRAVQVNRGVTVIVPERSTAAGVKREFLRLNPCGCEADALDLFLMKGGPQPAGPIPEWDGVPTQGLIEVQIGHRDGRCLKKITRA
eukprot:CAMPEP_0178378384 /NCGR_PEP_ID=MMETSP0689_2-20121128/4400_1 /TAXON_ID=160604 /ORGANISM="Amphidinium massartii, Strain CS-259" /LENGTH=399 /DNA_ID=CAMNT_0019998455 /DNA_START=27 /DNA_END=1226 /DNA_ORIENTATION=+